MGALSAGGETDVGEECSAEHRERKGEDHDVLLAAGSLTHFHSKERAKFSVLARASAEAPSTRQYGHFTAVERCSGERRGRPPPRNSAPRPGSTAGWVTQPPVMPVVPAESSSALRSSAVVEKRGAARDTWLVPSSLAHLLHRATGGRHGEHRAAAPAPPLHLRGVAGPGRRGGGSSSGASAAHDPQPERDPQREQHDHAGEEEE